MCAGVAAQTLAGQTWIVGLPCDQVSVQAVIDNNPQQVIGIACRQPDSRWLFVDVAPASMNLYPPPRHYPDSATFWYPAPVPFGLQTPFGFSDWLRNMAQPGWPAYRFGDMGDSRGARSPDNVRPKGQRRSPKANPPASAFPDR